jgi:hypothetical protein
MSLPFFAAIYSTGVLSVRTAKQVCKATCFVRYDDQVDMVGHEAVCPHLYANIMLGIGNQIDIGAIIIVREKGLLTAISALCHMVRKMGNDDSRHPCH